MANRQTDPLYSLLRCRCLCRPLGCLPSLVVLAAFLDCVVGVWVGFCVLPGRWGACAGPLLLAASDWVRLGSVCVWGCSVGTVTGSALKVPVPTLGVLADPWGAGGLS